MSKEEEQEEKPKPTFENYGFDLYPERRSLGKKAPFFDNLFNYKANKANSKTCEKNVIKAINKNPLVKLLLGALKNAGCPIDVKRHIVCEKCEPSVTGGYDLEFNQIVICENIRKGRGSPDATLIHELIHMYDYCVGNIDFQNLEHLACTEIRAANLSHCSFISSVLINQSSLFKIKKTHQYCVKMKAAQSMILARNINFETAMEAILKVFDKCYNDLEPIGRRVRRNSADLLMAYQEARSMGFCQP